MPELGQELFLGNNPIQLIQNNHFVLVNPFFFSFLFDEYPEANFGVSLRQLSSNYNGPCVKVRRTSDNSTSEIGFSNCIIDTNTLLDFAGASSVTVDTWYDQSGNGNNLTMPDTTRQPALVLTGSLVTGSASTPTPSLFFNGVDMIMTGSNFTSGDVAASIFNVYNTATDAAPNTATMFVYMFGAADGNSFFKGSTAGALTDEYMSFGLVKSGVAAGRLGSDTYRRNANELVIEDEYWISTGTKYYKNASEVTLNLTANSYTTSTDVSPSSINTTLNQFTLGAFLNFPGGSYLTPHNGKISELVSWPSNKLSERTLIQQQINNYYNAY